MNKNIPMVVAMVVVAGAGFFGGVKYEGHKTANALRTGGFQRGAGQALGSRQPGVNRGGFAGGVVGEVLSKDANSITVKLMDGGSRIVLLSDATVVTKQATGSTADLAVGTPVFVNGSANADGSTTAQMIQIRPSR